MPITFSVATSLMFLCSDGWATQPTFERKEDVIYGRKYRTALTIDVFTLIRGAKGIGVMIVVSGGFISSHDSILPAFVQPLVDHGYTVFAVVHSSQPRFTRPEIIQDMNQAVRFIRYHTHDFGIDPDHIGIPGASAGGHLSLMLGTAGDKGDPSAKNPMDRFPAAFRQWAAFSHLPTSLTMARPAMPKFTPRIMH
jgi:acetyl esterase/lipase